MYIIAYRRDFTIICHEKRAVQTCFRECHVNTHLQMPDPIRGNYTPSVYWITSYEERLDRSGDFKWLIAYLCPTIMRQLL